MDCCSKSFFSHCSFFLGLCAYMVCFITERWIDVTFTNKNADLEQTAKYGLLWYCQRSHCHPWGWIPETTVPLEIFVTRMIMLLALCVVVTASRTKVRITSRKESQTQTSIVISGVIEIIAGLIVWSGAFTYSILLTIISPPFTITYQYGFLLACLSGLLFLTSGTLTVLNRKTLQISPYGNRLKVSLPQE